MAIEKRSYSVSNIECEGLRDTVEAACDMLAYEYEGNYYIGDLIPEVADYYTPDVYSAYDELLAAVKDIEDSIGEAIREAIREGLVNVNPREFSFRKLLQIGYYEYLTCALYDNLDTIVFNHLANKWNESDRGFTDDDDEAMEAAIIKVIGSYADNNKSFDYYESKAEEAAQAILDDGDDSDDDDEESEEEGE